MKSLWITVCTISIVAGSLQLSSVLINGPKKRNMNSPYNQSKGIMKLKSEALPDYSEYSHGILNYILPTTSFSSFSSKLYTGKHHMKLVESSNKTETWKDNGIQHLCISTKKSTVAKIYKCQDKNMKSFVCMGEDGKLTPCNKYLVNKKLHEPLCIKKNEFAFVVPCNESRMKGFCFPNASSTDVLISCSNGSQRVCYRNFSLEYCQAVVTPKKISLKRRSIQSEKIDPRNIHCKDCEVDILMEVYEGSTPIIEVKIRPLNENIMPTTVSKDIGDKSNDLK